MVEINTRNKTTTLHQTKPRSIGNAPGWVFALDSKQCTKNAEIVYQLGQIDYKRGGDAVSSRPNKAATIEYR